MRSSKLGEPAAPPKAARARSSESRLSLSRESAKLLVPQAPKKAYSMTSVTRGAVTTSFKELKATPVLKLCPKPPPGMADSLATRKARKAALSRWHPSTNATTALVTSSRLVGEALSLVPAPSEMRHWRRGESDVIAGSYRQASAAETLAMIERIKDKTLKWTELDVLYEAGKTRVSGGTLRKYFYGAGAAEKLAKLKETGAFKALGAPRQVSVMS